MIVCASIGFSYRIWLLWDARQTSTQVTDLQTRVITQEEIWSGFVRFSAVIFERFVDYCGLNTFLVLLWIQILKQTEFVINTMLSFCCGFSAPHPLLCRKLTDKYGYRFIKIRFAILLPSVFSWHWPTIFILDSTFVSNGCCVTNYI